MKIKLERSSVKSWLKKHIDFFLKNRLYFLEQSEVHRKIERKLHNVPTYTLHPHAHSLPQHQHPLPEWYMLQCVSLYWRIVITPSSHSGSLLVLYILHAKFLNTKMLNFTFSIFFFQSLSLKIQIKDIYFIPSFP